jgi:hypothetical protein
VRGVPLPGTLIAAMLLLSGAGCAAVRPVPLPEQAPSTHRAPVKQGTQRCSSGRCRTTTWVGSQQIATTRRMHCDVRWVVLETIEAKRDGGDVTTKRIAERIDCEAMLGRTPGGHWHFSRGEPLAHDSAAPAPAAEPAGSPPTPLYALPMRLSREDSTNRVEATYDIVLDPVVTELMQVQMTVWRIRRADGTLVATLYWRYWRDASVLELSDTATPEEEAVLRLATVAALLPFESTR